MKNMLYGVLCSTLLFALLTWWTVRGAVHAAAPTAPSLTAGRFELVQLHPNAGSQWSGILDTETGCVWAYASQTLPASPKTSLEAYKAVLGEHFFEIHPFDAMDYVSPGPAGTTPSTGPVLNFSEPLAELSRVAALCNKARVKALETAAAGSK